jgi:Family of unknown function (DUF6998)
MMRRLKLPEPVAKIYRAVAELEARYAPRKFTPDGHLVGSIGEVVAAEALDLTLYPMSRAGHDACDADGCQVQIKMTSDKSVAMYSDCARLVVLQIVRLRRQKSSTTGRVRRCGPARASRARTDSAHLFSRRPKAVSLSKLRSVAKQSER